LALTSADHLRQAQYNESFVGFLRGEKSKWPAWAMTAIFYAAVHYVQALLVEAGHTPLGHSARNRLLVTWPPIRTPYMRLYQYSRDARYGCLSPDEKRLAHALGLLEDVKREVVVAWPTTPPPTIT